MNAEIITIGDEILIGQIIDTNSSWLGQILSSAGIQVVHRTSVSDKPSAISNALDQASVRADIIIMTGGLGPTKDDVTKITLNDYFKSKLILNQEVLDWVTHIFQQRNLPMIESNKLQAMVPDSCEVLFNKNGTAPGMWFHQNGKVYISMPGVPFEMKTLFEEQALPKLKETFPLPAIVHRTIQTCSIGESFLAKRIAHWENNLPEHIKLAYLPSVGQVRLRLSGTGNDGKKLRTEMQELIDQLYPLIGDYIFGEEDDSLPLVVGRILKQRRKTVSTAESCTGGYLAHQITSVAGSSAYYTGSIISYDNRIKTDELGIDLQILQNDGAVSKACVEQMAQHIRKKFNTDYSIATSGIAGPDGGTPDKPVGTVWVAVCSANDCTSMLYNMGDHRERTIQRTALQALDMLRKMLLKELV